MENLQQILTTSSGPGFSPPRTETTPFLSEARVPFPLPLNDMSWYRDTLGTGHAPSQVLQKFSPVPA